MNDKTNMICSSSPWVTCNFPDRCFKGYTMFTPMGGSVVWLIDMQGLPVHCWEMAYPQSAAREILPNGNLLYSGTDLAGPKTESGGSNKVVVEADWDGNILWEYKDPMQHHAFSRLSNGNTMVLSALSYRALTAQSVHVVAGPGRPAHFFMLLRY